MKETMNNLNGLKTYRTIVIFILSPSLAFSNAGLTNISDSDIFIFFYIIIFIGLAFFTFFAIMLKSIFGKSVKSFKKILINTLIWNSIAPFLITLILISTL